MTMINKILHENKMTVSHARLTMSKNIVMCIHGDEYVIGIYNDVNM